GSCSKNLFPSSSQSKGGQSEGKKDKEQEVDQQPVTATEKQLVPIKATEILGVEDVAESLGAVAISTNFVVGKTTKPQGGSKGRKWVRNKSSKPVKAQSASKLAKELGKRNLVDVVISEGNIDFIQGSDKKFKGDVVMEECSKPDVKAVRALSRLIRLENPQVVFLMETRLKVPEVDRLKLKLGSSCGLAVDCRGVGRERVGGLALFWKDHMDITIKSFSLNHIHGQCVDVETNEPWDLT
ncbi:hypothetical protein A2U01_0031399, partial [Trifolium medium]|nr:hypothetical protein [Trifolium medium]